MVFTKIISGLEFNNMLRTLCIVLLMFLICNKIAFAFGQNMTGGIYKEVVIIGPNLVNVNNVSAYMTFTLYTRALGNDSVVLTVENWNTTKKNLMFNKLFKFITHGWMSAGFADACILIKDSYLSNVDVNVIIMDWQELALDPLYKNSVYISSFVGNTYGNFIKFMADNGVDYNLIHLIGHSLGAHVSGFAGETNGGQIKRITGLDPALPGFAPNVTEVHLRRQAARFVDVIHTSSSFLGILEPIGHADFYPNGGYAPQRGCFPYEVAQLNLGCSHSRAYEYFAESTNRSHKFMSYNCNSWEDYINEDCDGGCVRMGDPLSPRTRGYYYLRTNPHYPFAEKID